MTPLTYTLQVVPSSCNTGTCSTYVDTGVQFPVWVPSFISDANYTPAKVLPRIMFYNGYVSASAYWLSGYTLPNITSIDDVVSTTLTGGTNVIYGGARTSTATITASDGNVVDALYANVAIFR